MPKSAEIAAPAVQELASVTDEHGEVVGQVGLSGNLRIATINSEAMAQHVAAKRSLTIEVWPTEDRDRSV